MRKSLKDEADYTPEGATTMDSFNEVLHGWQNFYFMIGGATAGLIGLMFVALSLGTHLITDQTKESSQIFVNPSVIYFLSVLMTAGVMLAPTYSPVGLALVLFAGGVAGSGRALHYARRLPRAAKQNGDFTRADWLSHVIVPAVSYTLIWLAALGLMIDQWPLAFTGIWLAVILLLLAAIANTWSLVTWIVEHSVR
jgi:hypothetical protein